MGQFEDVLRHLSGAGTSRVNDPQTEPPCVATHVLRGGVGYVGNDDDYRVRVGHRDPKPR
jgi:hypothetical protein